LAGGVVAYATNEEATVAAFAGGKNLVDDNAARSAVTEVID